MTILRKISHSKAFTYLFHYPSTYIGVLIFIISRRTPWISYWSMRKIFAKKSRSFLDKLSNIIITLDPKHEEKTITGSSLFKYHEKDIQNATEHLNNEGYYILPFQLSEDTVTTLRKIAEQHECLISESQTFEKFDDKNPKGGRYDLLENDLLQHDIILDLATDSYFLNIAQRYLGSAPINDMIAMWWNIAIPNPNKSLLAQMYHFDLDRLRFLKFFIYLTDVTEDTGPHCYIRKSHNHKTTETNEDRRFTDDEIYKSYGKENEILFQGKKGLILVEDTIGLHKGLDLKVGHRLIFQLEYTTSLFGQKYDKIPKNQLTPSTLEKFNSNPVVWQRFLD